MAEQESAHSWGKAKAAGLSVGVAWAAFASVNLPWLRLALGTADERRLWIFVFRVLLPFEVVWTDSQSVRLSVYFGVPLICFVLFKFLTRDASFAGGLVLVAVGAGVAALSMLLAPSASAGLRWEDLASFRLSGPGIEALGELMLAAVWLAVVNAVATGILRVLNPLSRHTANE